MKKVIRILAVVLVVVLTLSLFAGCGKKDKLIGKWEASANGRTITIEFKKNGDCIVGAEYNGEAKSEKGQWKMTKGDKLKIREDSNSDWEEAEYKLKGNKLTLNLGGKDVTFKKK